MTAPAAFEEPRRMEFGPRRAIGMACRDMQFSALWEHKFLPRVGEVTSPDERKEHYGFCRCLPRVTDGTFEYVAAVEATPGATVPPGMIEVAVPHCDYMVFTVPNLSAVKQAWEYAQAWTAAHPEVGTYCGPQGCECATHPGFELYPPDFNGTNVLYIYVPVK